MDPITRAPTPATATHPHCLRLTTSLIYHPYQGTPSNSIFPISSLIQNPTPLPKFIMKLNHNRKLLEEQNPFHYTTLTYSPAPLINDSSSSSTSATAATEVSQPFKPNSSPFDTSMALTILVLLTALFFMSFFSFYIRRYADDTSATTNRSSTNNAINHRPRRSSSSSTPLNSQSAAKGLDPSLIQSLPTICYGGDAKHRMECSICLSEFEETETVKLIPYCRHAFHPPCIDTWLASHVSCPLCRSTQLFDEVRLNVVEDNNGDGVGEESGRRSMAGDEWRREVGTVVGVRRTCSYSSIRDRLSLPRSNSF